MFIMKVCQYFDISYPLGTRVAVITYTNFNSSKILFHFNTFNRKKDVLNAIAEIQYQGNGTRTDLALSEAYTKLFENPENGVRPKELGVPRVLALFTDGKNSSETDSIIQPSNLFRNEGVTIFFLRKRNEDELYHAFVCGELTTWEEDSYEFYTSEEDFYDFSCHGDSFFFNL